MHVGEGHSNVLWNVSKTSLHFVWFDYFLRRLIALKQLIFQHVWEPTGEKGHVWVTARTWSNSSTAAAGILLTLPTLLRALLPSAALNLTQSQQSEPQCREEFTHKGPLLNHLPSESRVGEWSQGQGVTTLGMWRKGFEIERCERCKFITRTVATIVVMSLSFE